MPSGLLFQTAPYNQTCREECNVKKTKKKINKRTTVIYHSHHLLTSSHTDPWWSSTLFDVVFTHQDEAWVVSVPPAEGRHTDFWVLVVMENLASAVGVSTQDEAGLKPLQQLRRGKPTSTSETGCCSLTSSSSSPSSAVSIRGYFSQLCCIVIGWNCFEREKSTHTHTHTHAHTAEAVWSDCKALTLCEASLDKTSYFSLNSRCRSSGGAASCPVQPASLTLYNG